MNKISFLLSILAISTAALGQIPKKNIKGHYHLPNCLNNPIDRETLKTIENKDFSNEPNNKSGSIWTVFSDKADNPVFTAPGQSVTGATLRFHQPLWVTNSAPDGWLQLKSKVTNQKNWMGQGLRSNNQPISFKEQSKQLPQNSHPPLAQSKLKHRHRIHRHL